ncbi:hypothetical protein D3C76_1070430 [compost metagenome]
MRLSTEVASQFSYKIRSVLSASVGQEESYQDGNGIFSLIVCNCASLLARASMLSSNITAFGHNVQRCMRQPSPEMCSGASDFGGLLKSLHPVPTLVRSLWFAHRCRCSSVTSPLWTSACRMAGSMAFVARISSHNAVVKPYIVRSPWAFHCRFRR